MGKWKTVENAYEKHIKSTFCTTRMQERKRNDQELDIFSVKVLGMAWN